MKAAIFDAPHKMHIGEWQQPSLGTDDVMVKVSAAGICAGDLYIYTGKNPYTTYPVIGGHEVCGVVADAGSGAKTFHCGQAVVIEPFLSCGKCFPCREGKPNCCSNLEIIGVHRPGGYAEYVVVPQDHLFAMPAGLTPLWASFAEPVTIAIHACRRGEIKRGDYVLILGCGPIGLALIEVAIVRGARVVAVDVLDSRLRTAHALGAEVIKNDGHLLEQVLAMTHGEGAAVVVEATGNVNIMESTADLVAAGGKIVIVGLVAKGIKVQFPGLDFTRKEMTIVGSRTEVGCFPEALDLLASGRIQYPKYATVFELWSAPDVFSDLTRNPGSVHKGVFVFQ
ncbi:MAG: alcohol dehydrogenase catalytic domain-containing protein [Verrucomicrobia bacterium]|nr:alcohol dehydrogenase catalytic domain-containing protein [Verrucomicrobiota bacterium]